MNCPYCKFSCKVFRGKLFNYFCSEDSHYFKYIVESKYFYLRVDDYYIGHDCKGYYLKIEPHDFIDIPRFDLNNCSSVLERYMKLKSFS